MPKNLLFVVIILFTTMLTCGQDGPPCPAGIDVELPPYNHVRDEELRIHRLTVWETDDHQFEINETHHGTHDFCVTINDSTIPEVDHVYGQLLTFDGHLKYSMELVEVPELVGVYCHLLSISENHQDWNNGEIAIFRGWIIGTDDVRSYYNYRDSFFIIYVD